MPRRSAVVPVAFGLGLVSALGACGGSTDPVAFDLREPTTTRELGARGGEAYAHENAERYTLLLPDRTIEGPFEEVDLLVADDAIGSEGADAPIAQAILKYGATDDPDEVRQLIADARSRFEISSDDSARLDAWLDEFDERVDDGAIDVDDFEPGETRSQGSDFGLEDSDDLTAILSIGTLAPDAMSVTVTVLFDPDGG